jgi:hypothetical protein
MVNGSKRFWKFAFVKVKVGMETEILMPGENACPGDSRIKSKRNFP